MHKIFHPAFFDLCLIHCVHNAHPRFTWTLATGTTCPFYAAVAQVRTKNGGTLLPEVLVSPLRHGKPSSLRSALQVPRDRIGQRSEIVPTTWRPLLSAPPRSQITFIAIAGPTMLLHLCYIPGFNFHSPVYVALRVPTPMRIPPSLADVAILLGAPVFIWLPPHRCKEATETRDTIAWHNRSCPKKWGAHSSVSAKPKTSCIEWRNSGCVPLCVSSIGTYFWTDSWTHQSMFISWKNK